MQTPGDVLENPDGLCKQIRRRSTSNVCYAIAAFEFAISYWHEAPLWLSILGMAGNSEVLRTRI